MKAVIYVRYSSDNQREESIEGQLRENKAFAEKNGIEIIGTSHTETKYRYYKCNQAKKKKCDKNTVRKEWLEKLVIDTILELITDDSVIE